MKKFNHKKYWKKFCIRMTYKLMELGILFLLGMSLGLKLVRY
ncbi:MAG: hypothetical protein Q7S83_02430 [bacterium]|nr:hypothetical protein [bacterium]